jgi:arylsulfate sulfotransferase
MIIDPADSNLLVSFRHQNQVVKLNRHTGDIMWRLGGRNSDFPLTKNQLFLRQHNVVLTDNNQTLMIFDNGERNARPMSRVLEFKLDQAKKTITSYKAFNIPEPFTESLGSVQKIGDYYLICGGTANYVLLVNSITGDKKMEMKMNQASYRAWLVNDIKGINVNEKQNGAK